MLRFDNHPPHGIEDMHISKTGHALLESAIKVDAQWALTAYGRSALSEIIDAFDGEIDSQELETYRTSAQEEASSEFGFDVVNFGHGMEQVAHIVSRAAATNV